MAYTPTQWNYGDIITAEKLNNIESGISNSFVANQGSSNAGKFLVVGNDGVVVPVTISVWQGGSY